MRGSRYIYLIDDIKQRIAAGGPARRRRFRQHRFRWVLNQKRAEFARLNVGERHSQRRATFRMARFVKMNETVTGRKPQLGILGTQPNISRCQGNPDKSGNVPVSTHPTSWWLVECHPISLPSSARCCRSSFLGSLQLCGQKILWGNGWRHVTSTRLERHGDFLGPWKYFLCEPDHWASCQHDARLIPGSLAAERISTKPSWKGDA